MREWPRLENVLVARFLEDWRAGAHGELRMLDNGAACSEFQTKLAVKQGVVRIQRTRSWIR